MKQLKLTFLLSVLMSMVGAEALAYNFKVDGICYDFYDGSSVEVAANSQYSGNIVIPSTVDYNGKTYNVVRIGYRAFAETYHLESITIPLSVTSIGDYAFSGSLITAIDIPSSVVRIGDYVFNKCKNLTSITIPSSVRVIGEGVFCECQCLTRIVVDSGNTIYDSRNNCNAVVETGTNTIVHGCCRTIIPNSVTAIGDYAFIGCQGLRSIEIPSSVINIGSMAFRDCTALTSVTIGCSEPIAIGYYTFSNRTNATLYVPVGSKAAYEAADYWKEFKEIIEFSPNIIFADDNVKAICVQNWDTNGDDELSEAEAASVSNIGTIFQNNTSITSFEELKYFTGLKSLDLYAFSDCKALESISIPVSITQIGTSAFDGCNNLKKAEFASIEHLCCISFGYSISNPTGYAKHLYINGQEVSNLIIPEGITRIGRETFLCCEYLNTITIPYSVTEIGEYAFQQCIGLTTVTIPNSVTSIGETAFEGCI